jgi:hypothetical protein
VKVSKLVGGLVNGSAGTKRGGWAMDLFNEDVLKFTMASSSALINPDEHSGNSDGPQLHFTVQLVL